MAKRKAKSPFIKVYKKVFTKAQCNKMIKAFEASQVKSPGQVAGGYVDATTKSTTDVHLNKELEAIEPAWRGTDDLVYKATGQLLQRYNDDTGQPFRFLTGDICDSHYLFQKYSPNGKDQFKWHSDSGGMFTANRFIAMVFYLNDVEEGGETRFLYYPGNDTKPKAGSVLMFPAGFEYVHAGMVPVSGPKYMISTFIEYSDMLVEYKPKS